MDVNKIVTLDEYEEYLHEMKISNKRVSDAADSRSPFVRQNYIDIKSKIPTYKK